MANEIQGSSQEVPQSLKTAEKKPLDGRARFATLAEATAEAYEGATFYVAENGGEWYKFKLNAQGVLVAMADSSIDASQFALKSDLNGLATSVIASAQNDGLMKAADYLKLANINPSRITKVRASTTNGKLLINDVETTVYARENTPEDRPVTDTEKESWNGKAETLHYHATLYAPLNHNHNTLYAPLAHEHQVWDNTLGRFREKYVLADSAGSGGNATTLGGLALNNNATGVGADDAFWSATKVKEVVDAKANEMALGNSWKPAVATFSDIATTYPNPQDGWTVPVKDIDHSWRWNGTEWVDLGGVMPMASQSVDGKMSAIDKTKLDGIAEGANNYVHPAQHLASIIQEETDKRFMTDAEKSNASKLANVLAITGYVDGAIVKKPNEYVGQNVFVEKVSNTNIGFATPALMSGILFTYPPFAYGYGNQVFFASSGVIFRRQAVSATVWDTWATVFDSKNVSTASSGSYGWMSAADKIKMDGIAPNANNYTHPANHPASMISEEVDKRFMLDAERTKLSGLFSRFGSALIIADADSIIDTGLYVTAAQFTGSPFPGVDGANQGYIFHQQWNSVGYAVQMFFNVNTDVLSKFRRKDNGVWSAWFDIYTSANLGSATQSAMGLMSATDKEKIDRLLNENSVYLYDSAGGNVRYLIVADDSLYLVDENGQPIYSYAKAGHMHNVATYSADGLMSAADKAKLDSGVAIVVNDPSTNIDNFVVSGLFRLANNPGLPSSVAYGLLLVIRGGNTIFQQVSDYAGVNLLWRSGNPTQVGGTGSWSPWRTIYHSSSLGAATTAANGLMTAADKTKLDSVATGATKNKTTVSATMPANPSVGDIWIIP